MKCPTCESCEYEQYCGATEIMRKCERHNKKVEQTNEEWIKSCNTEQLAEFLRQIYKDGRDDYVGEWYEQTEEDFVEWLKQPHQKE